MSVTKSYCICSIPRSGSSLLSSALRTTEVAGRPAEHFNDWFFNKHLRACHEIGWLNRFRFELQTLRKKNYKFFKKYPHALPPYVRGLLRTQSIDGVYGMKLHHSQYLAHIYPVSLGDLFGPMKYIVLTRRDRVRQAVSWARAEQTKRWFSSRPEQAKPKYDFARIVHAHAQIVNEERQWNEYLSEHGIEPLRLVYEDFVLNYRSTLVDILSFLELPASTVATLSQPDPEKQSDHLNAAWAAQYCRDLKAFADGAFVGDAVPDVRKLLQNVT